MDLQKTLERYNLWWKQKQEKKGILRSTYKKRLEKNLSNDQIIFVTGLRRVGKTTIIKQFINHLIEAGTDPKKILFVSLDDPLFTRHSLLEIIDEYRKINKISFEEKIYLFFDEISYKKDFSQELKSINDHQNVKIYATGSNSLDIQDKKAFLTGRVFNITIHPLTFEEYLTFKNIDKENLDLNLKEAYFEEYLKEGGMPQYVLTKDEAYIKTIIEDIIYKDIARTHNIRNIEKLKELFLLLCERVGKRISYNKLSKIVNLDSETVAEYSSYFQQTFLFSIITKHAKTLNERTYSQKKIYISDNGIKNVFVGYKDKGSMFENHVFNTLKTRYEDIFYYLENDKEIDFIIRKRINEEIAIEVKYRNASSQDLKTLNASRFKIKKAITSQEELEEFIR